MQGPGCRDLVRGAGCNVLGARPWAACARGTACAADDADRTELSLENGAGSSLLRSPCPEKEGRSQLWQGGLQVWVQGWGKVLEAEHKGFALG